MNSVIDEKWESFTLLARNIIRKIFSKTKLTPLSPPNMIKNTQECIASINHIAEDKLAHINFLMTRAKDSMVVIQVKGTTQQPSINILLWVAAYNTLIDCLEVLQAAP